MPARTDLEERLSEHIEWLGASAERYGAGHVPEAKRVAVTIRSLVHDTALSKSLLAQTGLRDRMVWRSAVPVDAGRFTQPPWIDVPHESGFKHIKGMPDFDCDFTTWWRGQMLDFNGTSIDRAWFVLQTANFDGGAHVDPVLPEPYRSIAREGGLNPLRINSAGNRYPDWSDPVPSALRTICTEIVISVEAAW